MTHIRTVLLSLILLQGCSFDANAKSSIEFEDGQKVSNCADYDLLRSTLFVKETVDNMIIQSEYLDCSLKGLKGKVKDVTKVLDIMRKTMRIRKPF